MDTERAHRCRRLGAAPLGLSPWVLSELGLEKESKVSFLGSPPRCVGLCGCSLWVLLGAGGLGQVSCGPGDVQAVPWAAPGLADLCES